MPLQKMIIPNWIGNLGQERVMGALGSWAVFSRFPAHREVYPFGHEKERGSTSL